MSILLKELMEMADDRIAEVGFDLIEQKLNEMRTIYKSMLLEGFMDNHRGDLDKKFDEVESKLISARRSLGYVNSAKLDPEKQREYKSRVMRNINIFSKQLYDLMIEMGMSQKEVNYHLHRLDMDREFGKPSEVFQDVPASRKEGGNSFRDHYNKIRNTAAPEDMGALSKPKVKSGENQRKWYQRFFR